MKGVIEVEEPFHPPFATLTAIQRKGEQGGKAVPLNITNRPGQCHQCTGGEQQLFPMGFTKIGSHRHQNTEKAVIDGEIGTRKQTREGHGDECHAQQSQGGERTGACVVGVDQQDGQGESHQDALEQRTHGEEVHQLAEQGKTGHLQQVLAAIAGVGAALGDHIGIDGEGQTANDAQPENTGKHLHTDVIQGHSEHGQQLQLIGG